MGDPQALVLQRHETGEVIRARQVIGLGGIDAGRGRDQVPQRVMRDKGPGEIVIQREFLRRQHFPGVDAAQFRAVGVGEKGAPVAGLGGKAGALGGREQLAGDGRGGRVAPLHVTQPVPGRPALDDGKVGFQIGDPVGVKSDTGALSVVVAVEAIQRAGGREMRVGDPGHGPLEDPGTLIDAVQVRFEKRP